MSVSKEVRTGILVAAALAIFFVGFYFLKGADLFSKTKEYNCIYKDVDGLQGSTNVLVKGMVVGHVTTIKLIDTTGVKVVIAINKNIELPEGTVAELKASDLLNPKIIELKLGRGPGILPAGATLPAENEKGFMDDISGAITPRLRELKVTIETIDTAIANINDVLVPIKTAAGNLAALTGTLSQESGDIKDIIHNLNSFTANLSHQNDTINQMLSHMNSISGQLAKAPIQKTVADLQSAANQLKGIMDKINNNQGSLGMLINNKDLYNNLNSSLGSLQKLMDDIKAHPTRYINVTIFGKKKN